MAERKVDIIISAQDAFTSTLSKAQAGFQSFADGVRGKAEQLVNLKTVSLAAGAALAGLGYEMVKAIEAASESEAAEKRLTTALGFRSQALLDQAGALQKTTAFEDDAIVGAQALIAAYVKDESQIKAATKATLDLAAAKGMDLQSAAELVAKSLGTETNALARQGVEVEGAIGSAQRLESLTNNIARLFGGQAAAQAETFSGKVAQLKNAFGDLQEEIGFVITKNAFVIKAVDVLKKTFEELSNTVNANRQYLMELTKSGILTLVDGMGKAVEVMRFFHNGWLGLKLVGNATAVVLADSLRIIFEGMRIILSPLDLIFEGLVRLGTIEVNPFDRAEAAIGQFQLSSRDVTREVLKDIKATNSAYDKAGQVIAGFGARLREIKVAQAEATGGARGVGLSEAKTGLTKEQEQTYQRIEERITAIVLATEKLGASKERLIELETIELAKSGATVEQIERYVLARNQQVEAEKRLADEKERVTALGKLAELEAQNPYKPTPQNYEGDSEVVKAIATYDAKLNALQDYNTRVIQEMISAGKSQAEIEATFAELSAEQERKKRDLQLAMAGQAFGAMSTMMQNLYVATGSKNKAMFKAMKAFAIAETVIQTYRAAQGAYAALSNIPYVGPALGVAAAAAALAAGMARVVQISSMEPGGSGSMSAGGSAGGAGYQPGAPSAYTVPERVSQDSRPVQNVNVYIQNGHGTAEYWGKLVEENIVPALNSSAERKVYINVG